MTTRPYKDLHTTIRLRLSQALKHIERIDQGTFEQRLCQIAYALAQCRAATALLEHRHQVTIADAILHATAWTPQKQ